MAQDRPRRVKRETERVLHINRTNSNEQYAHEVVFELPEMKGVPKVFTGFIDFIRTQGVVGLGVGFIVGTSAQTVVKSVVTNIFNPIIGSLTGGIDLSTRTACLQSVVNAKGVAVCTQTVNYGQVISDLITFLLVLFLVYLTVKSLKLDKIDKKKV